MEAFIAIVVMVVGSVLTAILVAAGKPLRDRVQRWMRRRRYSDEGYGKTDPKAFIPRKECRALEDAFHDPNKSVLVIHGIGGIGKSSLAASFLRFLEKQGHRVIESPFQCDGLNLESVITTLGTHAVFGNFFRSIAENSQPPHQKIVSLVAALEETGQYGLFFDDYHKASDPDLEEFIRSIAQHGNKTKLVITTRVKLELFNQSGFEVINVVEGLPLDATRELLCLRAPQFRDEPIALIEDIWRKCHFGHPYALVTFCNLARRERPGKLLDILPTFNDRDKNWQRRLFDQMTRSEQQLALAFSILRKPPNEDDCESLGILFRKADWKKHWHGLLDRGVVYLQEDGTFAMHDLFREFCGSRLSVGWRSPSKRRNLHDSAANFYLQCPVSKDVNATASCLADAVQHAELAEWPERQPEKLVDTLLRLSMAEKQIGKWREAERHAEQCIAGATKFDMPEVVFAAFRITARIYADTGRRERLLIAANESHALALRLKRPMLLADSLDLIRRAYRGTAQLEKVLSMCEEATCIAEQKRDYLAKLMVDEVVASVLHDLGRTDECMRRIDAALETATRLSEENQQLICLKSLGQLYRTVFAWDRSLSVETQVYAISTRLGLTKEVVNSLQSMTEVLCRLGRFDEAVSACEQAVEIARSNQDEHLLRHALASSGWAHFQAGELEKSIAQHQEHFDLATMAGDPGGIGWAANGIGEVLLARGEAATALSRFTQAIGSHVAKGESGCAAIASKNASAAWLLIGDLDQALTKAEDAVRLAGASESRSARRFDSAEAELALAQVSHAQGKTSVSLEHAILARDLFNQCNLFGRLREVNALLDLLNGGLDGKPPELTNGFVPTSK